MRNNLSFVYTYVLFVLFVTNATLVPFINKCKMDDSNCIIRSAQAVIPKFAAGIPELGVGVLDPAYFKKIDASTETLKLILNNVYIKGLKGCIAKRINFQNSNKSTNKLSIKVECSVELDAQYEMKGQLLVPIEGKGNLVSVLSDTIYKVDCDLADKTGKDKKNTGRLKIALTTMILNKIQKYVLIIFSPNNIVLAQATQEVIDRNPDIVISEVGPAIVKCVIDMIVNNIGKFSENVPIEDLVL